MPLLADLSIAAPANAILADGATITGSVGVYAGKFVLSGLWDKLGINWSRVQSSTNAGLWTSNAPFTPEQWQKFQQQLDRVYADFVGKVAQGRKLETAKVEAAAGGRIWTGQDAVNAGLVDRVGGLTDAVQTARNLAGLAKDREIALVPFPAGTYRDLCRALGRAAIGADAVAMRRSFASSSPCGSRAGAADRERCADDRRRRQTHPGAADAGAVSAPV